MDLMKCVTYKVKLSNGKTVTNCYSKHRNSNRIRVKNHKLITDKEREEIINDFKNGKFICQIHNERHRHKETIKKILKGEGLI